MVLSESKRFLFIHIPKTAGTSIRQVLEPYGVSDYVAYSRGLEQYVSAKRKFPPHLSYAGAAEVLTVDLGLFFKFTFVRNPWDRYVSMYEYFRGDAGHAMHARCTSCSFEEFIDDVTARRATFDTKCQLDYLAPPPRSGPLDFIGRVENIARDFAVVCGRLGIDGAALPVLNATERRHYRSYYSDAAKRKIAAFCEAEIAMFGYGY